MRFLKVFGLLCGLGALAGAVVGIIFVIAMGAFTGGPNALSLAMILAAAIVGALVGGALGPPMALAFLRHVPLWRATLETAAGASLGFALSSQIDTPFAWVPLTLSGATLAAIRLSHAYRKRGTSAPLPNEELKPTASPSSFVE